MSTSLTNEHSCKQGQQSSFSASVQYHGQRHSDPLYTEPKVIDFRVNRNSTRSYLKNLVYKNIRLKHTTVIHCICFSIKVSRILLSKAFHLLTMFLLSSILVSNRPRLAASRIPENIANVLRGAGFIQCPSSPNNPIWIERKPIITSLLF